MGILNSQRFLAVVNEANPYNIWRMLSKHFTSNAEDNQARIFPEFLASKNAGSLEQFITDVTQHIRKIASVGIIVGSPGDIKEALVAKIIQDLNDLVEMSLKNEQAFNAQSGKAKFKTTKKNRKDYSTCSNGRHNPQTKHTEAQYCELKGLNNKTANQVLKNDNEDSPEEFDPLTVHAACNQPCDSHDIILDSGSSHHMTPHISVLQDYQSRNTFIHVANGESFKAAGKGFLQILLNDKFTRIPCLHVPSLTTTLISLRKLCQLGHQLRILNFVNIQILIKNKIQMNRNIFSNGIFYLSGHLLSNKSIHSSNLVNLSIVANAQLLHARAGHPTFFTSIASSFPSTVYLLGSSNTQEVCAENPSLNSSAPSLLDSVVSPPAAPSVNIDSTISTDNIIVEKRQQQLPDAHHVVDSLLQSGTNLVPSDTPTVTLDSPDTPPKTYRQALVSPDSESWLQAIDVENRHLSKKVCGTLLIFPLKLIYLIPSGYSNKCLMVTEGFSSIKQDYVLRVVLKSKGWNMVRLMQLREAWQLCVLF
ncbi:hypothetical protein O181_008089 [Austropuccinia psidii MF-1]|uniref:Retrovirus-related Pol polyprotein from transposon TNT 1-94-like beta-barrel domain-containing protein n=1 Tax=Austropuccinia psidii MF-1 TaxID=1389203 RepID=A0A9Q3BM22_9BASI|nr:hypothetical protein [Austropuccinia psidii MF-1]